jgi:hypothetical protein
MTPLSTLLKKNKADHKYAGGAVDGGKKMESLQANRKYHLRPFKTLWGVQFLANFDILAPIK